MRIQSILIATGAVAALMVAAHDSTASSHREAPFITKNPKVDATDFYMFQSYEAGRTGYTTLIANYQPLQDPIGGPNYFTMDPNALYEIHVDNDGDAKEDITFQFQFQNTLEGTNGITLPIGPDGGVKDIPIPLVIGGQVNNAGANINVHETYTLKVVRGNRRTGTASDITDHNGGSKSFKKPMDNIGEKSFPGGYASYANQFKRDIDIPGCSVNGKQARVFVGQRAESFAVNLGVIFDLIDAPAGVITTNTTRGLIPNPIGNKNVTTLALEIPTECLTKSTAAADSTIGGWTTASVRQARVINPAATYDKPSREGGAWAQVSRLGSPLVNEVVIGLKDKDRWNSSEPSGDTQFADYVTNPSLAALIEILFGSDGAVAPKAFPRNDLVAAFLTGIEAPGPDGGMINVNKLGVAAEYLRLNTGLPVTPAATQKPLGALECFTAAGTSSTPHIDLSGAQCDPAGFPNGRRPIDDTVDIALRVMIGRLLNVNDAPAGALPLHDAVGQENTAFDTTFPYLKTPKGGTP